jgi:hypothetical protein
MATLSIRMRDDLKRKAQRLAQRQGVSLNNFINATVAASVAQDEVLAFFDDRLKGIDLEALHQRVLAFMAETTPGTDPTIEELQRVMGLTAPGLPLRP